MAQTKVFHLEMDGEHYYFGSPKAIFDIMGEEKMGMKYSSFHSNITLSPGDVYVNRRKGYIIRVGLLGQCKSIMETLHVFLVTSCLHGSKHTLYILSDGIHNQCIL